MLTGELQRQHQTWKQVRSRIDGAARPIVIKVAPPIAPPIAAIRFIPNLTITYNFALLGSAPDYLPGPTIRINDIVREVCIAEKIKRSVVLSVRRDAYIVRVRFLIGYLCWELTNKSLPEIGRWMGDKDHSSVLHWRDRMRQEIAKNSELGKRAIELMAVISEKFNVNKKSERLTRAKILANSNRLTVTRIPASPP